MNGILVIDKPQEFTSFDVIAVIRKITGQRKAGHTGTLDPNATGVLPVLLGSATKAQDLILNHDKTYEAKFRLGLTSDTLDIWGSVTSQCESHHAKEDLLEILPKFTGEIEQIPPMFSAVQKNGQRLYDLARKGIEVEREARKVTVYRLELLSFDEDSQEGKLAVECSKGTYIRTIIDDLGKCLGCGAVMTELRRTKACGFSIEDCITLDRAKQLAQDGALEECIRSVESMFAECGYVAVTDAQAKRFSNGGPLDISRTYLAKVDVKDKEIYRVKTKDNRFLGLGIVDSEKGLLKIHLHT
ncbi:MAG: tRNA pseudouridine(55) synthase TruB [Ruminococcus sp.]|nr:tRNA pseudouridine(55) synthase TruB [Ruminococcus sp.]